MGSTDYMLFGIFVVASALGAYFWRTRIQPAGELTFKDVLKRSPELWAKILMSREALSDEAEAAKNWDEAKIAAVTQAYLFEATSSYDARAEDEILRHLRAKTHPAVFALLRDPALYQRWVTPTGDYHGPEAPLNRACSLLRSADDPPAIEVVELLAPFLHDSEDRIRNDAIGVIASTGDLSTVPYLRLALADEDEYVRSSALDGLETVYSQNHLSKAAKSQLISDLLSLLRAHKNADKAGELLYQFAPEQAIEFFLSPEVFTAASPILHHVLQVLADAKEPVPHANLMALIAVLEQGELKYPQTYSLAQAYRLLGQHRRAEDRELLQNGLTHANDNVAEGAAQGLLCSYDLEDFEARLWETDGELGGDALTLDQKYYLAVFHCDGEICNGGFSQYFFNSSGNDWPLALAGYQALGLKGQHKLLQQAVALFGPQGPSQDCDRRHQQLSKILQRNEDVFDPLDEKYYAVEESVSVALSRFVLKNPESFR